MNFLKRLQISLTILLLIFFLLFPYHLAFCLDYYIDYKSGDDNNIGSREYPWKHHPWDQKAEGKARKTTGNHTYLFKKGSIYRGSLIATESGSNDKPITLTADPSWGIGDALIYGSERISGGWNICNRSECDGIPQDSYPFTWYKDINTLFRPRMVFEQRADEINKIQLARIPNYSITDHDDPRKGWWEWTESIIELKVFVVDPSVFKVGDTIYLSNSSDKDNFFLILGKGSDWFLLEVVEGQHSKLKPGIEVFNKSGKTIIKKIDNSRKMRTRVKDKIHLVPEILKNLKGATVWTETEAMPFPFPVKIEQTKPSKSEIIFNFRRPADLNPRKFDRYYIENHPSLLDHPNEWYFQENGSNKGRLFLRLSENRNPNHSTIEVAKHLIFLDINNQQHIAISNIKLRFFNSVDYSAKSRSRNAGCYSSLFRITGKSKNISISDCDLSYSSHGISIFPNSDDQITENFTITNNLLYQLEGYAIRATAGIDQWLMKNNTNYKPKRCRLKRLKISNNNIKNCGSRAMSTHRPSIHINSGELIEISQNKVDMIYGPGIRVDSGSFFDLSKLEYPLIRTLIHDNNVTNSMLAGQDYGGISSWFAGPAYIYNNISGNAVGYMHSRGKKSKLKDWYRRSSYGVGIYLDQQYKGYVFNNIIWGKKSNTEGAIYNSVGFNEAQGSMNAVFNNTIYRVAVGLHKGMIEHNRCYYLNNLFLDIGNSFITQKPKPSIIEYNSLAFAGNVFFGRPRKFGQLGSNRFNSLREWQRNLKNNKALVSETGVVLPKSLLKDEANLIPYPGDASLIIDKAKKVFVPWGLYAVVGEWNFYKHRANLNYILGEHLFWNKSWKNRQVVNKYVSRNDLISHGINGEDFEFGILENWVEGALRLDGKSKYCTAKDSVLLDMANNNFLIETIIKAHKGSLQGIIVSKVSDGRGFELSISPTGHLRMDLFSPVYCLSKESLTPINDGEWHHIIAEVDRDSIQVIRFYLEGREIKSKSSGRFDRSINLSNPALFTVGRGSSPGSFLKGSIDFLRVSRGTLVDAETTINELYSWEFNGPFLKDFYGHPKTGEARDVGAIEITRQN